MFQALPADASERAALRAKLLHYLLDPVLALNPAALRREVRDLENDDVYDVIFESFRDALALYDPAELWSAPPRIPEADQRLLRPAGELVVSVFSPRGGAEQVTLALAALATMAPEVREWRDRLDQVMQLDRGSERARRARTAQEHQRASTCSKSALGDWPAPAVVTRLDSMYLERQQRVVSALRRPGGGESARRALGELLLAHGDEIQRAVVSMAGVYLRAGLIGEAARRTAVLAGQARRRPRAARPARRRRQARRGRRPTIWRWRGGSCRASISWAARRATRPIRSSRCASSRPASRAAPTMPRCWCSRATSPACCRRTSSPSGASRRPSWCSSTRRPPAS